MEAIIENKVAKSGLITFDLEAFYPKSEIVELDIAPFLFQGLLLKEKEYREYLSNLDWSVYSGKIIAVYCSTDAILAPWSFMLVVQHASGIANRVLKGNKDVVRNVLYYEALQQIDWTQYTEKRVLLKGCGDKGVSDEFYAYTTEKMIQAGVNRLMYGEACSFVPVYRK